MVPESERLVRVGKASVAASLIDERVAAFRSILVVISVHEGDAWPSEVLTFCLQRRWYSYPHLARLPSPEGQRLRWRSERASAPGDLAR